MHYCAKSWCYIFVIVDLLLSNDITFSLLNEIIELNVNNKPLLDFTTVLFISTVYAAELDNVAGKGSSVSYGAGICIG